MATATVREPVAAESKPRLCDGRVLKLCAVVLMGFASFAIIGPVLPILILELGVAQRWWA